MSSNPRIGIVAGLWLYDYFIETKIDREKTFYNVINGKPYNLICHEYEYLFKDKVFESLKEVEKYLIDNDLELVYINEAQGAIIGQDITNELDLKGSEYTHLILDFDKFNENILAKLSEKLTKIGISESPTFNMCCYAFA